MNPIINPWWIYLSEKSETLGSVFLIIGILTTVAYAVVNFVNFLNSEDMFFKKYVLIISIMMVLVGTLLPSQKTVLTMMTVQQLTPDNIKIVGNTVEDTVDYIVEKIEDIIEEDE